MIGFQKYIIDNNISVPKFAKEIDIKPNTIWRWFNVDKVPNKYHELISIKLGIDKEYINKIVNDINTNKPRKRDLNRYEIHDETTILYVEYKKQEYEVMIDTEDLPKLIEKNLAWHLMWREDIQNFYVITLEYYHDEHGNYKAKPILLHRFVSDAPKGVYVDHENHITLDNRKSNLRFTSDYNNAANRKSANSNNKTGVRNVHLVNRYGGKQVYLVQIMRKGERFVWEFGLDEFEEACIFAEMKRQELFGEYAGNS